MDLVSSIWKLPWLLLVEPKLSNREIGWIGVIATPHHRDGIGELHKNATFPARLMKWNARKALWHGNPIISAWDEEYSVFIINRQRLPGGFFTFLDDLWESLVYLLYFLIVERRLRNRLRIGWMGKVTTINPRKPMDRKVCIDTTDLYLFKWSARKALRLKNSEPYQSMVVEVQDQRLYPFHP